MFERFTQDARVTVVDAQKQARRLGHRYIGGEHILLAAVSASNPASAILHAHGLTPQYVEGEIVRRVGRGTAVGTGAGLFGSLDRDALASIGIDLDTVRARIEASFGPQALARADIELRRRTRGPRRPAGSRRARLDPRPALRSGLIRRRHRGADRGGNLRAPGAAPPLPAGPADAPGRNREAGPPGEGHIPFTPVAKRILELTLRETLKLHDSSIGVEHIALALTVVKNGMVPSILAGSDTSAAALHAEILDRYRQAG
jgi:Clp amino terminal domain, pathogenicity island component